MARSEPVREQILANLALTLSGIVEGSEYWNTVTRVERQLIDPKQAAGLTVVVWSPDDAPGGLEGAGSATGITQTVMRVHVDAIVEASTSSDTLANRIAADIEKAVLTDRYRGGYARNTRPLGRQIVSDETTEPMAFLRLTFTVLYRHDFAAPGTQR